MSARKSIVSSAIATIEARLSLINGRRRMRTIDFTQTAQAIREALRDGCGYVNGGTVRYTNYPSIQTKVTAISGNGFVLVNVKTGNAGKGAGTGLPWNRNASDETIAEMIEAITSNPLARQSDYYICLTRRIAQMIVARQNFSDAQSATEVIPPDLLNSDTLVTVDDSLAAGNCVVETNRVKSWFADRDAIPAKELFAAIIANAPSLASFAVRAVMQAQSRAALVAV